MDDRRFDNLIRALQRRAGSRRALAAALAGLSLPLIPTSEADAARGTAKRKRRNKRKRARTAKSVDAGVRLFELLAAQLNEVTGDCDALAQAAEAFKQAHLAEFDKLASREQQWDAETRARVAKKFQARITRATESLHTLMASCQFRGAAAAPVCAPNGAPGGDPGPVPGEAQCTGCDCSCICPISGWDCTLSFFACLGGSHAACCWFGACAGNMCAEQCPNCCNCGPNCCGC